jgi:LmbE family N-acetylglucosaminyl deacetylase
MNILAVGCHPDDIEVACAGTLAKYKKQGHNVTICHMTNGNMGHVIIEPDELRVIRIAEAKKSGSLAGIEVLTCDLGDLLVYDKIEQRDRIIEVIRKTAPDVIITHSPDDYMPDHVAVSKLVFDASFAASVPHYGAGAASKITPLYYMDTLAGVNFMPTEYVDISDEIDIKLEMLECHVRQMKWMRDHDKIDVAEFVKTCARFRGLQCGTQYAEAFTQCYAWPKIIAARVLP